MAKLVSGQAAVALPVLGADGDVRAVVGFAFAEEGELPVEQLQQPVSTGGQRTRGYLGGVELGLRWPTRRRLLSAN